MIILRRVKQDIEIFTFGGIAYCILEILWRRYTHWTMGITGGICFLVLFRIYSRFRNATLLTKCFIGSCVITIIEFISGCIVNLWLKMNVWDYSNIRLNVLGQICLLYSFFWGIISIPIDYISKKINNRRSLIYKKGRIRG